MKTNIITINNLEKLEDLDLHDSRIGEIKCNYDTHEVYIPLELDLGNRKNVFAELKFCNVRKFSINILEPWGEGIYINEVKIENQNLKDDSCFFELVILINSGDEISIISNEINYFEK